MTINTLLKDSEMGFNAPEIINTYQVVILNKKGNIKTIVDCANYQSANQKAREMKLKYLDASVTLIKHYEVKK